MVMAVRHTRSGELPPQICGGERSACASQSDLLEIPVHLTRTKLGYGADGKLRGLLILGAGELVEATTVIDDTACQRPDLFELVDTPDTDMINTCNLVFIEYAPNEPASTAPIRRCRHHVHLGAKMV